MKKTFNARDDCVDIYAIYSKIVNKNKTQKKNNINKIEQNK